MTTSGQKTTVNVARPLGYLCAAGAVAAGALLLPGGTAPAPAAAGQGVTNLSPTQSPAAPACSGIRESLRPDGPLPAPGAMPPGSTMAAIAGRGRLIAGVDQGKYLAGYRDPQTGQLAGADIDIVHSIAKAILGDPGAVQFVVLDIADREKAVKDAKVDLVVDHFTVTCSRQRNVEFSSAYMTVTQRLLVPVGSGIREVEDLDGQPVCTSRTSTNEGVLRALGLNVVTRTGIPDCVVDLQRGRVAAVSSDDVILAGLAAQDPQTRVVGRALDHSSYGVGMRLDQPDLVRFVNALLERSREDGSLAASNQRWLGDVLDPVPQPPPARYRD